MQHKAADALDVMLRDEQKGTTPRRRTGRPDALVRKWRFLAGDVSVRPVDHLVKFHLAVRKVRLLVVRQVEMGGGRRAGSQWVLVEAPDQSAVRMHEVIRVAAIDEVAADDEGV